jgi:hypothetical protein
VKAAAALLVVALGACNHVSRADYFQGWRISPRYTPVTQVKGHSLRSGHLLVRAPGNVVSLEYVEGDGLDPDTQVWHMIRVELPDPPRRGVTEHPVAYNQHCPGVIGICEDEPLLKGRVTVRAVDAGSVVAELDLEFAHIRMHRTEAFESATPHEEATEPP